MPDAADLESKLAKVNDEIARDRGALAEVRVEAQAIAREAELADRRLQAIAIERKDWNERKDKAATQITTIAERTAEAKRERGELSNAPQQFAEQRQTLIGRDRDRDRRTPHRCRSARRSRDTSLRLPTRPRGPRLKQSAKPAPRPRARRNAATAPSVALADVEHEIRDLLDVEPAEAAEIAELKPDAELPAIGEVEEKLDRIRRERERLGSVNLLAEQELREVEAQHDKLIADRDDLVEAIRRLRQGIHSLNHEARERLLASFETVNEHFKRLFAELFGGGNAELQLIESEDPLEAGLEIMAKPPGKKPVTLSLLSGGEQALTALALIFAVFLTNPAPICVLDEVDAPLDDYNVERFCDLLDEMTRATDTRFIIITHNPITMARMNRLYGVTMAERGVSQLVSVDLEGAVKLREAGSDFALPSTPQLEQSHRALVRPILSRSFSLIGQAVEPVRGVVDVFERPVGREHDPVGADFQHGVEQRRGVEIARRRDMEIFAEIIANGFFRRIIVPVGDPGVGIVDRATTQRADFRP